MSDAATAGILAAGRAPAAVPERTRAFAPFEWLIAVRYLRARRSRQGFVSVIPLFCMLGIMIGVAALIIVMSVMNGFRHELIQKLIGVNGHVYVETVEEPMTDYADIVARLSKVPGVKTIIPLVEGMAAISSPAFQTGGGVRGISEADLKQVPGVANNIKQGSIDGFEKSGGIAIGQRLANDLRVGLGDKVSILTANGNATAFGNMPRRKAYPVVAIFQVGRADLDAQLVFMPFAEAQAFFNKEGRATVLEGFVDHPDQMDAILGKLEMAAGRAVALTDWRDRNRTFVGALNTERNVMFVILSLIIVVAVFNIIAGLVTLVTVKAHDIAILRTMGATRGAVMRIFILAGASIGGVGTLLGFGVGVLIAANVENMRAFINRVFDTNLFPPELYFLSHLPSIVEPWDVISVCLMAFGCAILATLYPSWQAAKLDPVEALRAA